MTLWSLSAEILALILIIVIGFFSYEKGRSRTARRKIFDLGLLLAAVSIILNIICVFTLANYEDFPYWLNMLLNSAYFLISVCMCTTIAVYFFDLLLEHVYSKVCRTRAARGLSIVLGCFLALLVANIWTGWLFSIDKQGVYHRGILNKAGYALMLIELGMVVMCYFRNKACVENRVVKVMHTLPPVVLLLFIFQLLFPTLLLNGTIVAFSSIIIFANFQNFQDDRDGVTGIGNRKSFYDELMLRLKGRQQFQIITVSLLDFAMINKQFSHRKGDEFLYHITHWLEGQCKEGHAFRFGNVTFALLCPYINSAESEHLLTQIEERFQKPWIVGEMQTVIPASFGMLVHEKEAWEATQVIDRLSFISTLAKTNDTHRVVFNKETEHMFRQQENLLLLLQDSLEKKRFRVWYQPVFDCRKQKFFSAEALIRLRDYKGNMVSPAEFIPLAEENGMIEEIGWFVLEEVIRFLGRNPDLPIDSISINMSMSQYKNPGLYRKIKDCLDENHVPANKIKLEITERVLLSDTKYMEQMMKDFSANGLQFAMDDFGTGYSNFSSIMHLPFEFVKLDKSLLNQITTNKKDRLIIKSMIDLFHALGLATISEGIETEAQQQILQEMGTDYIQGFYYAKPMPEAAFTTFLTEKNI